MTFQEWLDEMEGYSARWERLYYELPECDEDTLTKWLRASYDVGYEEGRKDDRHS